MSHPQYAPHPHNQQRSPTSPSPSTPFSRLAPRLLALGYTPVPIKGDRSTDKNLDKAPAVPTNNKRDYPDGWKGLGGWQTLTVERLSPCGDKRPTFVHWCRQPDLNIGVLCGAASGHIIALDLDIDDEEGIARIMGLPGLNVSKVGKRGVTRFFRYDPDDPIPSTKLAGCLDLLAEGKQTVIPPSVHPDLKRPYQWVGDHPLDQVEPADLPLITMETIREIGEELARRLGTPLFDEDRSDYAGGEGNNPFWREVKRLARADLDAWVPSLGLANLERKRGGGWRATASWRAGGTGLALHDRKRNLHIDAMGCTDFGDKSRRYSPIDLVAAALPCSAREALMWLLARVGPDLPPFTDPPGNRRRRELQQQGVDVPSEPAVRAASLGEVRAQTGSFVSTAYDRFVKLQADRPSSRKINSLIDTDREEAERIARTEFSRLFVYVADPQPGLGKTHALLNHVPRFYYMSTTNKLAHEVANHPDAGNTAFVVAQSGSDPETGKANCARSKELATLREAGGVQSELCNGCDHAATCGVVASILARAAEPPPPRIASTHGDLVMTPEGAVANRMPVCDEMPDGTLVGSIEQREGLPLRKLVPERTSSEDRYPWLALEFIKAAIEDWHEGETARLKRDATRVAALKAAGHHGEAKALAQATERRSHLIPASIFNGISGEDIDADRIKLIGRGNRRRGVASKVAKEGGAFGLKRLAHRVDGEHQRDARRLAILDAVNALDFDHGPLVSFGSAGLAIDLDGRDIPIHSIKLRPISGEIAKAGVILLMTATAPDDETLRAMFRTTVTFISREGRALVVDVEPVIIRQGAPYVARPEHNTIRLITGGNPTSEEIEKKAPAIAALINFQARGSADPMPVATTGTKAKALAGRLVNAETKTHAAMTGINTYKDAQHVFVLGDARRPPAAAETYRASLHGIIVPRHGWAERDADQPMTDGTTGRVRIKVPTLDPTLDALDWPEMSPLGLPAPLAGLRDAVAQEEVWRAQSDVYQALERIRLLHDHPAGLPKTATAVVDMVMPFPVTSVTSFAMAIRPLPRRDVLRDGIGVIPGSPEWAQELGIKGEIGKNAWREQVNFWSVCDHGFPYKNLPIRQTVVTYPYVWRCRVAGSRASAWTPCISLDPPVFAMPRLAKALNLTLQLNPEDDITMTDVTPTGRTQLEKYGFARTERLAKTLAATIKPMIEANPDGYRVVTVKLKTSNPLPQDSVWLVRDGVLDPAAAIRTLLADSGTGDTLIEIKELPQPVEQAAS